MLGDIPEHKEVPLIIQEKEVQLEALKILEMLHNALMLLEIKPNLQSELKKNYDILKMLLKAESGAQLSSQLEELKQLHQEKMQILNQYMKIADKLCSVIEDKKIIQTINSMKEDVRQSFQRSLFVSLQANNSSSELIHVDKDNDDPTPELIRTDSEDDVRNNPKVDMIAVQQQPAVILADSAMNSESPGCFARILKRIWKQRNDETVESVKPSSQASIYGLR